MIVSLNVHRKKYMKVKHLIPTTLFFIAAAALIFSCAEERDEYVRPSYGVMRQEPNPAHPGQNVVLTIEQTEKGNGIAGTTYEWTIKNIVRDATTNRLKDTLLSVHTNYDGYDKQNPTLTFQLPENCAAGSYTVEMEADFSCYIGSVLYDVARASGQLKVQ